MTVALPVVAPISTDQVMTRGLAIDVGAGTQDVLVWEPNWEPKSYPSKRTGK